MRLCFFVSVVILAASGARAETVGWWRLEGKPDARAAAGDVTSEAHAADHTAKLHRAGDGPTFSSETPDAFVYDPQTGKSVRNTSSLRLQGDDKGKAADAVEIVIDPKSPAWRSVNGFTVEAFVKHARTPPPNLAAVVRKTRLNDRAATWELRAVSADVYKWWSGSVAAPGKPSQSLQWMRYMDLTHVREDVWRHLALTYDAETKTARFFVDYTELAAATIDGPLSLDAGSLFLGGHDGRGLNGWLDEVRVSDRALEPWHFLRATPHDLKNVSFKPTPSSILPPGSGFVDLRLRYGAVGDGVADDTRAFQRAFDELASRVPISFSTLYIPAGKYLISDTIQWSRFLIVQGEGRDKTLIKLKDECPGFGDAAKPKSAVVASNWGGGQGGSGSAIASYLFDAAIDTGRGNPGAIGLQFHANNAGAVENVTIRSGDGTGVVGLDFTRPWCGPCLIKNVKVEGFDVGVKAVHREYSLVFSGLDLSGQKVAAIDNRDNILSIENLTSKNSVPVIRNGGGGLVVLLNATLDGGAADAVAIDNQAVLYARNVRADGYKSAIRSGDATVAGPEVKEWHSHDAEKRPLNLPVEATPEVPWGDFRDWVNVTDYQHLVKDGDWAPAIQAAIDSGKATVYFPANLHCVVKDTVHIRGKVRRLFGMRTHINGDAKALGGRPALRIDGDGRDVLVLERLDVGGGEKVVGLEHASSRPLVLRHVGLPEYRNAPGCGPVFFEDVAAIFRFLHPQKAWARQINPETKDIPEIVNDGADLWVLGLKTEYASTNIVNRKRASTEILGGLIYPVTPVPKDMPMFVNDDSRLSLICAVSAYPHNHPIYVQEVRKGEKRDVLGKEFKGVGGRPMIPLYVSP